MNNNVSTKKVREAEIYRNAIVEIIEKIKPECLERIYALVIYLYLWK